MSSPGVGDVGFQVGESGGIGKESLKSLPHQGRFVPLVGADAGVDFPEAVGELVFHFVAASLVDVRSICLGLFKPAEFLGKFVDESKGGAEPAIADVLLDEVSDE